MESPAATRRDALAKVMNLQFPSPVEEAPFNFVLLDSVKSAIAGYGLRLNRVGRSLVSVFARRIA